MSKNFRNLLYDVLSGNREVSQLKDLGSCATFLDLDDDSQYIRWQWASRHRNAVNFPLLTGLLAPLFEQAMKDPILSQVTPYTSHTDLYLSRCTEYPFWSDDHPFASPTYYIGHYHRYVVQKQNLEEAERLLLQLSPEVGAVIKTTGKEYEFRNAKGEFMLKSDPIGLLEFIIDYTYNRYDVADRKGNGLEAQNAKETVEFLRNALSANGYPSIRGSADDLNL